MKARLTNCVNSRGLVTWAFDASASSSSSGAGAPDTPSPTVAGWVVAVEYEALLVAGDAGCCCCGVDDDELPSGGVFVDEDSVGDGTSG